MLPCVSNSMKIRKRKRKKKTGKSLFMFGDVVSPVKSMSFDSKHNRRCSPVIRKENAIVKPSSAFSCLHF